MLEINWWRSDEKTEAFTDTMYKKIILGKTIENKAIFLRKKVD